MTEWERAVKAAELEDEVSCYTLGEVGFLSEFEKEFPRIKVKVVQGRGNELLARIMTERRAGKYLADVAHRQHVALFSVSTQSAAASGFCIHSPGSPRRVKVVVGEAPIPSLRVDISKTNLRPIARRKEGAKYMVTWKAEWMDAEPMQKVVNQALAKSGRAPQEHAKKFALITRRGIEVRDRRSQFSILHSRSSTRLICRDLIMCFNHQRYGSRA